MKLNWLPQLHLALYPSPLQYGTLVNLCDKLHACICMTLGWSHFGFVCKKYQSRRKKKKKKGTYSVQSMVSLHRLHSFYCTHQVILMGVVKVLVPTSLPVLLTHSLALDFVVDDSPETSGMLQSLTALLGLYWACFYYPVVFWKFVECQLF